MWLRRLVLAAMVATSTAASEQKVIVVGFDGVDANYTERWMNEGKLPNLAKLRANGTYRPLLPTTPAQTPVSWSTFSTGIDPGRTGIFDFLRRDPKTYLPVFAAFDETTEPLLFGKRNPLFLSLGALLLFALIAAVLFGVRRRAGGAIVLVLGILVGAAVFFAVAK